MTDDEILADMRLIVASDKNGGDPVGWRAGTGRRDSLSMLIPLDILAPSIGTAQLMLRAVQGRPDRDCSATLVVNLMGREFRAWRMDWRPAAPHTNQCGSAAVRGVTSETAIHDFANNAKLGLRRMQTGDLPICMPTDEPHNFDAFVRYVYTHLKIAELSPILSPPWSSNLPL